MRHRCKSIEGSNPSFSANIFRISDAVLDLGETTAPLIQLAFEL